ncbi:hypothetical protein D3C74_461390 [compost metagenome]
MILIDILKIGLGHMAAACVHNVLPGASVEEIQIVVKMLQITLRRVRWIVPIGRKNKHAPMFAIQIPWLTITQMVHQ